MSPAGTRPWFVRREEARLSGDRAQRLPAGRLWQNRGLERLKVWKRSFA